MSTFRHQDIVDGVRHALEQAGLTPTNIIMDGTLQRCAVQGKPRGRDVTVTITPPSTWGSERL